MATQAHQMWTSSGSSSWRTPPELMNGLLRVFGEFQIDLAATRTNAVATTYLGPGSPDGTDALKVAWSKLVEVGFLNPPYSLLEYREGIKAGVPRTALQHLLIENWASKAFEESQNGFTTVAVMPYAPQTAWFRCYVMGHADTGTGWRGHAALDYWRIPHRVTFLRPDGTRAANANVNTCIVIWGPNEGFVGPWTPSGRYWTYRR